MCRRLGALVLGVLVLSSSAADQKPMPPAAQPPKEDVEKAIKQLGDEKFSTRAAALKQLEKLGPEILPLLKEAFRQAKDPETRRRLEEMLPSKEHAAALSPTRISLTLKDSPAKEAIAALSKQSGYKLELSTQGDAREKKPVSLEIKDATFWEAFERVCDACGMYYQEGWYGPDQMSLRLDYGEAPANGQGGDGVKLMHHEGPFRVSAKGFNYSRNVEFQNPGRRGAPVQQFNRTEYLSMNISISAEPKLPMLSAGQALIAEAVDENNQSMVPPQQQNQQHSYYYGNRSFTYQVQAQLNPTPGLFEQKKENRKIKLVKGTIPITALTAQREKLVVEKIMEVKNQTFKAGTATLTIESVTRTADNIEIKMSIVEGGARNEGRMNTLAQRFSLLDDKGNKYYGYVSRWSGQNNGGNGTMNFHSNGQNVSDPVKLVFYEWTTVTHNVPFEFKELPLP